MMPIMLKQNIIPFRDLQFMSLSCQSCKTEVILDISRLPRAESGKSLTPQQCPSCMAPFDSAVRQHADTMRNIYAGLSLVEGVNFRVSVED